MERKGTRSKTIEFDTTLYPSEAIDAAIGAFSDFAKFEVKKEENRIRVTLSEIDPDYEEVLAYEFANYALAQAVAIRGEK